MTYYDPRKNIPQLFSVEKKHYQLTIFYILWRNSSLKTLNALFSKERFLNRQAIELEQFLFNLLETSTAASQYDFHVKYT